MRDVRCGIGRRALLLAVMALATSCAWLVVAPAPARAATYYVSTTGLDTNDGTANDDAHAWKTVHKGLSTIADGDTLVIRSGTYAENSGSGYLYSTRTHAATCTIRSESGVAADVVITGTSGTTNTLVSVASSAAANLAFENVTFQARAGSNAAAFRISKGTDYSFSGCTFIADCSAGGYPAFDATPATSATIRRLTLTNCTASQAGANGGSYGFYFNPASYTLSNVTLTNCTCNTVNGGVIAYGPLASLAITGGTYTSSAAGPVIKLAATASGAMSGATLSGVTVTSSSSNASACGVQLVGLAASACGATLSTCTVTAANWALYLLTNCTGVVVTGGIYTGTGSAHAIYAYGQTTAHGTLTFTNVTASGASGDALYITGATGFAVAGGSYTAGGGHGVSIGGDGASLGGQTTGTITGAYIRNTAAGHSLLCGWQSTVTVRACTVWGGDYGIVVKESAGTTVKFCRSYGGTKAPAVLKATTNCSFRYNTLVATVDVGMRLEENATSGHVCTGSDFQYNRVVIAGSAKLIEWSAAGDGGGNSCDSNRYSVRTSAASRFGTVFGTECATFAALRAAWTANALPSNDSHSRVVLPPMPGTL